MKRFLTLALLASSVTFPAMAQNNSASSGASVGTGVGVGADVGVGAGSSMDSEGNTMNSSGAQMNSSPNTFDSSADAETDMNAQADTDTGTGRTASGDTSVGGSAGATASADQQMRGENLARNDVILIQQALRQEGFYQGTADGIWGPRTASALMEFQQRQQLGADGQLNSNTLDKLGVELGGSGANSNNQSTIDSSQGVGSESNPGSAGTY